MPNASVTFALEIGYYDSVAEADVGKEVVLATPRLEVFFSASVAAAEKEGLNIVEGDLWFFASDPKPEKYAGDKLRNGLELCSWAGGLRRAREGRRRDTGKSG